MLVFKTPFINYSVKFIPLYKDRLVVAFAQNFGILANGHLHVLSLSPHPSQPFTELAANNIADGIYHLAWSKSHDSLIVGTVKLCDTALPPSSNPIANTPARSTPPTTTRSVATPSSLTPGTTPSNIPGFYLVESVNARVATSLPVGVAATSNICLVSLDGLWFMIRE